MQSTPDPVTVLVVDDEKGIRDGSERIISRMGCNALTAKNGEEGLDIIGRTDAAIVLLDLKMPGIDGLEVLKKVKKSRPEIEVVVLTGHGSQTDKDICMELGAFAYLQKPVDIDELSEILKKAHAKIRGDETAPEATKDI